MIIGRAAHPNGKTGTILYNDDDTEVSPETVITLQIQSPPKKAAVYATEFRR
jgi:hypothetical protein